jgi:hypothetical protein
MSWTIRSRRASRSTSSTQRRTTFGADPVQNTRTILQGLAGNMDAQAALGGAKPPMGMVNTGGVIQGWQQGPAPLSGQTPTANVAPVGPGITTTVSPETLAGGDVTVNASQADVEEMARRGITITKGQPFTVPKTDQIIRSGHPELLPPQSRPPAVVNTSNGKPASPTNQPRAPGRQVIVPGATPPAAPAAAAPAAPAAPPAAPAAPPAPPPAAPVITPAPATPAPPAPAVAPVVPPAATPAPPAVAAPPAAPARGGRPEASLLDRYPGSTQVASLGSGTMSDVPGGASGLTFGAPSPPNALAQSDVNAMIQGIDRARGAGRPAGTQTAGVTWTPGGMGTAEKTRDETSQELGKQHDNMAAAYATNMFPYVESLAGYGRGMVTAPGSDFANQWKGRINGVARSLGAPELFNSTVDYDKQHKFLANVISSNPGGMGSDARLAQTLAGNANTTIHELTGADMIKAGIALARIPATARSEWTSMNPSEQAKYGGDYVSYLREFNKTVDPRAYAFDMMNPEQKKTLRADLAAHDDAYSQMFLDSLARVRKQGYLGGNRKMP